MKDNRREFIKKGGARDHIPSMVGSQTGSAFSVGYMKGLLESVVAEG